MPSGSLPLGPLLERPAHPRKRRTSPRSECGSVEDLGAKTPGLHASAKLLCLIQMTRGKQVDWETRVREEACGEGGEGNCEDEDLTLFSCKYGERRLSCPDQAIWKRVDTRLRNRGSLLRRLHLLHGHSTLETIGALREGEGEPLGQKWFSACPRDRRLPGQRK